MLEAKFFNTVGDGTREVTVLHALDECVTIECYVTGKAAVVALVLIEDSGRLRILVAREKAPHLGTTHSHVGSIASVVLDYSAYVQLGELGQCHGLPLSDVSVRLNGVQLCLGEVHSASHEVTADLA